MIEYPESWIQPRSQRKFQDRVTDSFQVARMFSFLALTGLFMCWETRMVVHPRPRDQPVRSGAGGIKILRARLAGGRGIHRIYSMVDI